MGTKIFGYAPSSATHETPTETRDVPVFQISGMSKSFGAMAVCLYVWNATNSEWEPMTQP